MSWLALAMLLLGGIYFSTRYAWWRKPLPYDLPRILMYHMIARIEPGHRFRGLRVSPELFERQLAWLKSDGWHFATMAELFSGQPVPEKTLAITFDDGYADNLTQALPLLKKYEARATIYLVVDRHERDWSVSKKAHHNSGELAREPKLTDEQVQELLASGSIELGAHSLTHPRLTALDDAARQQEIAGSREALEKHFAVPVTSFAYPFGIYGERDVQAARDAGFVSAVTTNPGVDADRRSAAFQLKRVKVSGREGLFAFKLRIKTGRRGWHT